MFSPVSLIRTISGSLQSFTSRARRSAVAVSPVFETLEQRALFAVTPDPGNTFATAFNVGDLNGQQTFNNAVNVSNLTDFYKFTMPRAGMFFGRLRTTVFNAQIDLFREQFDANGKPQQTRLDFRTAGQD